MKKMICAFLALILLQCSGIAYAGFSPKSFSGPYGGSFSGDLYNSQIGIGPIGNMTMTFQLTANGAGKAVGTAFVTAIKMVENIVVDDSRDDVGVVCDIVNVDTETGRGLLDCVLADISGSVGFARFGFVIVDSQPLAGGLMDIALGYHPHHVNNLLLNGVVEEFHLLLIDGTIHGTGQLNSQFK